MLDEADTSARETELAGFFLHAAGNAFVHLRMLGGPEMAELCAGVEPMSRYPYPRFAALLAAVGKKVRDMDPILEELGVQMMTDWFHLGPGKGIVSSGLGFLKYQTGSEGYRSVVNGPAAAIGEFSLVDLDEGAGSARVRSTTPFPRPMERGVLIGGMRAPGDLAFVEVANAIDPSLFQIRFR